MHLFYAPGIRGEFHQLSEEESRHMIRVLRLKTGDIIFLTDGKGNLYETLISDDNQRYCQCKIKSVRKEYQKRDFHLHIAIAPTKNIDRFEWFLEKATEIGIDEITPLRCIYSERTILKTDRLQKVIIAAMKQSLKTYLPLLHDPADFNFFVREPLNGQKFIAICEGEKTFDLKDVYRKGEKAVCLIGPEGDFSQEEIEMALKNDFIPISLGKSRLRTETAGIVACHTINLMNG